MAEQQPQKSRRGRNLSLFVLLIVAISCCGLYAISNGLSQAALPTAGDRPARAQAPAATAVTFSPIRLTGRGDDVVSLDKPDVPAIIHLTHQGSSNFIVSNYDGEGVQIDLLVNEIGRYDGVRPLDFGASERTSRLEIQADGAWTAVIQPITAAPSISVPNTGYSGRGDAVLRLTGSDPDTATLSHTGDSNFIVMAYGRTRDLLVNEIGAYNGTVIVPRSTVVIEVMADGNWELAITGQ